MERVQLESKARPAKVSRVGKQKEPEVRGKNALRVPRVYVSRETHADMEAEHEASRGVAEEEGLGGAGGAYHICPRRKSMPRVHKRVCLRDHDPGDRICQTCGFYKEEGE